MKAKMKLKRLFSFLLTLVMVVGMLPAMSMTAYAESTISYPVRLYQDTNSWCKFYESPEKLYYTNGRKDTGTLKENPNWNAQYDPTTETLVLRDYIGGRIEATGVILDGEKKNHLTIKLIGKNKITNDAASPAIRSQLQDYLNITSDDKEASLTITNTSYHVGISGSNVYITNYANVTVNFPILPNDNKVAAYGILAEGGKFSLTNHASYKAVCTNQSDAAERAYGIWAEDGVTLNTYGEVNIDVSQAGDYSYGIFTNSENNQITRVSYMIIRYKRVSPGGYYGGPIYPKTMFDSVADKHAININDSKGIATYRLGETRTPRTVTVTNGTCDATGTSTGQFFEGDIVNVTANEAPMGYKLKSWASDDVSVPSMSVLSIDFTMPDKDVAVSAVYAPIPCTVTFNANGHGTAPAAQTVDKGNTATKPKNPTAEGYTFDGWYKDAACTMPFDFSTPITEDTTLYAKWVTGEFYTVTFNVQGLGTAPDSQIVEKGGYAARPTPDPTAEGWIFDGWYKNQLCTIPFVFDSDEITKNTTVYADWSKPLYVTFDANGGTGTMDAAAVAYGVYYTLPDCGFTAPEGMQFKGWALSADSTTVFECKAIEVMWDTTLYAIWEDLPKHTITVTDGKATADGVEVSQAAEGTTVTLTANAASEGQIFDKWVVESGSITLADANSKTTTFTMTAGEVSVKATYKDAPHTHSYSDTWNKDADKHWKSCECGEKSEEAAHTAGDWIVDVEATETTPGSKHKECSVCGYSMETAEIPAKGTPHTHSYSDTWNKDADKHWKSCACGEKSEEAVHTASDWIVDVEATETTPGSKHKECSVCGYSMETAEIPAKGTPHTHSYSDTWNKDADKHWKSCACGEKSEEAVHTASDWIVDVEATETTPGSKHKECSVCGYSMETAEIPAKGTPHTHSYSDTWNKDADKHWKSCACGEKSEEAVHTASDWIVDKEATETAVGSKHKECIVCGYKLETADIPATGKQKETTPVPAAKGKVIKNEQGSSYKVTKSDAKAGEVTFAKPKSSVKGTVKVPDTVTIDGITYKVTAIEANAFKNNKNITKVIIGNNVKVIGKNAFAGCKKLSSVTVGKKVKTISAGAFSGCAKLKTVKLGAAVTTIGDKAFYKCTSLTGITIPSKVTKIGKSTFEGCKKLKTITVKSTKLKSVGSRALKGIYAKAKIKVPKSKLAKYKSLFKNKGQSKNVKVTK